MNDWELVPVEPTDEMIQAADCAAFSNRNPHERLSEVWTAMLNAAPQPDAQPDAQPVAWIDSRSLDTLKDFDATVYAKGGFDFATPLYLHPPAADVQELVEALQELKRLAENHTLGQVSSTWVARVISEALAKWEGK